MEFLILDSIQKEKYFGEMQKMLIESDDEFVPPLSKRNSTTQKNLSSDTENVSGILGYFGQMKKQNFIIACDGDELCAFVSYIENYEIEEIRHLPDVYISTVVVKREYRGKGITSSLYNELFRWYPDCAVYTRTWSTNFAHIKILSKLGFEVLKTIKDDRGEGIDTVYFEKF